MNNLDVILESIINEGNKESQAILDKANKEANEIIAEAKARGEQEAKTIIEAAKRDSEVIKENEAVSSHRESRDIEISAKNQVIDSVIEKLLANLKTIDADSYKQFVTNTLAKSKINHGEIILAENQKEALKNEDFNGLTVADDTVEDGFVVRSGKIEYDNKFSSIIKFNLDDIRKQISDEIFS